MELATASFGIVAQELKKLIEREAKHVIGFSSQLEELTKCLEISRRFLLDKANLENKDIAVREALIQLREVVYEADNILTDCLIRQYKMDATNCFGCFLQYGLFFLNQTGKKLKDINSKMKAKEKILSRHLSYMHHNHDKAEEEHSFHCRRIMSQDLDPEIVGLEDDIRMIKEWIFDPKEELRRIAIVGMGGLGKTTIAQKIFHDSAVLDHFDKLLWVTVSQSFSPETILRCMLQRLEANTSSIEYSSLMGELQRRLKDKTCLLVMDDVWPIKQVEWWTQLCSILTVRSCIIITTRDNDVPARIGVEESRVHKPKTLSDAEGWSLFSKFAFCSGQGTCSDALFEKVGKEILKKCGGLPLAIKVVGSLLSSKVHNLSAWEDVLESFHKSPLLGNEDIMASLRLSYNDLPAHLKQCLLCLSIYPEDIEIRTEQIIHWWVAEGLVHFSTKGSSQESVTDLGYECLLQLISRSLVDVKERRRYDGRVFSFKIHDMVREMIITIAEEEAFCFFDEKGKHTWKGENCHWLGFTREMDEKLLKNNSKLRALYFFKTDHPADSSNSADPPADRLGTSNSSLDFDKNSRPLSLRGLDFSGLHNEKRVKDLFDWICSLRRLACLNVSNADDLQELPSTISKLLNLQLLVLNGCTKLEKIPSSITSLKNLIVLDLVGCPLRYFPRGLGRLSNLQELKGFKVVIGSQARNKTCGLGELKNLIQLRVLHITITTTDDATEISESHESNILSSLAKLKVLIIDADEREEDCVLKMVESLSAPPSLQELYLRKYNFEYMPIWFNHKNLSRLQYLCVEEGKIVYLKAREDSSGSNWSIRGMSLKYLPMLKVDWEHLKSVMPLRNLEVSNCSALTLRNFPFPLDRPGFWSI
ncbi:Disease resistance RPP13-like protein 4 [Morus notabilis]|uniref:Disease resistance RPP13-like protein 4 n=1 Tax=Morus notabilis TaxID=981085 RepID=W9QX96_9ROSA|nr:disease resistance RPP13-like protein 4 [Morus notabilis]EXB41593.1 Disease resistance RPP13-like protein 4 [Morus notabilis]